MAKKTENILVLCAHSDDQIFGPGATLAKYASEGNKIFTMIFSYGEASHPHLKKGVAAKMRVNEAKKADKVIGGSGVQFLGLFESGFSEQLKQNKTKNAIKRIIMKKKPLKIFTHSDEDPHPAHRAVADVVLEIVDNLKSHKPEIYAFDVWGFNIKKTRLPKLYIDVTEFFDKKIDALKCFPSQWISLISLLWTVYVRAIKNGFKTRTRFAERFYKMR